MLISYVSVSQFQDLAIDAFGKKPNFTRTDLWFQGVNMLGAGMATFKRAEKSVTSRTLATDPARITDGGQ